MNFSSFIKLRISPISVVKQIQNVQNYANKTVTQSVEGKEKIVIHPRIERGPTDLLRALACTIKPDPTAAHFKYHDDPYLIPKSNMGKRTFAMAQEAGRKAAVWVRQQHPDLFEQTLSDPPIKAFMPQKVFNENSEVSEDILLDVINNVQVSDAIIVYNLLQSKNVKISRNTTQALLELLCFYNCEDTLGEELIEERWFTQDKYLKDRQRKTWKDNSLAEQLFASLTPPDSASYSALIQGMCKYCQVEKGWLYFEEAQKNNVPLTIGVYNSLIRVVNFLRESNELRWKMTEDLLSQMQQNNVKPNLGTLNAVLEGISNLVGSRQAKNYILSTLAEFKSIGIEPSLASWYYILITLCKDRGPQSGVLYDIMDQIGNQEFKIQDPKDTHFFVTAMDVCRNHLQDVNLAKRVDQLLHLGNNYDLIGDSYKESIYYRHFFALVCKTEPLEIFMEFYDRLVPNVYTPEPGVMVELLRAIELNGAIDLLPRVWSDMVMFDHTDRENLLTLVLNIMVKSELPLTEENKIAEQEKYLKITWDIFTKINDQPEMRTNKLNFTGQMLGDILTMCVRCNDFEKANTVMKTIEAGQSLIVGMPDISALESYLQFCIDEKRPSLALNVIQYCADGGYSEAGVLARKIISALTVDEEYMDRLMNIVGKEVLQIKETKSE